MVRVLIVVTCLLLAGCSSGGSTQVAITVDQPVALADQQVHLKVTGLHPGKPVTVGAEAADHDGRKWHGEVTLTADDHGTVDLDTAKPAAGGCYQDVDGMGLFWSMNPPDGDADTQSLLPPTENGNPVEHLDVYASLAGKRIASTTLTRKWVADGVTAKPLTMTKDKLVGSYVAPRPDGAKHPAVLLFGGSEGGMPPPSITYLLASRGYPVLMLGYFNLPGLPKELREVPLEYFATAARWLAAQPAVDPAHVVAMAASFGSEAALLIADHFPELFDGAVVFAPGASTSNSFPQPDGSMWSYRGRPLGRQVIPVGDIDGPVLAIAGSGDALWPSATAARSIMRELDTARNPYPHHAVIGDGAGHGVGGAPYLPRGTRALNPVINLSLDFGGTRRADELTMRQGWAQLLALLKSL
jgi:dienelactone hydrolase